MQPSPQNQFPEKRDELSASFLIGVTHGYCETYYNLRKRTAHIQLQHPTCSNKFASIGDFKTECLGILNSTEHAVLRLGSHELSFHRTGYNGDWKLDQRLVARSKMGFARRWCYFGSSMTRMEDGTLLEIKIPIFGPSHPQYRDCVCSAIVNQKSLVQLFIARPEKQPQLVFAPSQLTLLEQQSEEIRIILLGELLRVRTNYNGA